jgi:hypothetical protein
MLFKLEAGQEKMEAAINCIWFELEGTVKKWVEHVLLCVDQWTHYLHRN